MALYRTNNSGGLGAIPERDFGIDNYEERLEGLLEKTPQIPGGEDILFIGRQVPTKYGPLDLLGLNSDGDATIIELKRGLAPRDVIAQALSYTAWINQLSYEELNKIAERYYSEKGKNFVDLVSIFGDRFVLRKEGEENGSNPSMSLNLRQKIYIIAQDINEEVVLIAKFLRKQGVDIYCIRFTYHTEKGNGEIFNIEWLVGGAGDEKIGEIKKKAPMKPGKYDEFFDLFVKELKKQLPEKLQPSYIAPNIGRNYKTIRYPGYGPVHYELRFIKKNAPEPSWEIGIHNEPGEYNGFLKELFYQNKTVFDQSLNKEYEIEKWGKSWERIYKLIPLEERELDADLANQLALEMKTCIEATHHLFGRTIK